MDLSNEDLIELVGKLTNEKSDLVKQLEQSRFQNLITTARLLLIFLEDNEEYYGSVAPAMAISLFRDALKALEK